MVESFYFLPAGGKKREERLTNLLASYQFLSTEYARVIEQGILAPAIARFREHFNTGDHFSDQIVVDSLIWQFVVLLKKGAIRNRVVAYG